MVYLHVAMKHFVRLNTPLLVDIFRILQLYTPAPEKPIDEVIDLSTLLLFLIQKMVMEA